MTTVPPFVMKILNRYLSINIGVVLDLRIIVSRILRMVMSS